MPCFHPITAYHKIGGGITWTHRESNGIKLTVSCKQCTGCRQEYARQWAMRNIHEASLWLNNIFITLTYNEQNLPEHNKLVKKDFQDFMKRLRKHKKQIQRILLDSSTVGNTAKNSADPTITQYYSTQTSTIENRYLDKKTYQPQKHLKSSGVKVMSQ